MKYYDDTFYDNPFYARIGGIPPLELNDLELELLLFLDFQLFVPSNVFRDYYEEVCSHGEKVGVWLPKLREGGENGGEFDYFEEEEEDDLFSSSALAFPTSNPLYPPPPTLSPSPYSDVKVSSL